MVKNKHSENSPKAPSQNPAKRAAIAIAIFLGLSALLFLLNPEKLYLWVKAVHVIGVISWMAGMLYLPRLFVNHCGVPIGSQRSELLKGMEQRLLRIIINPAMIITWVAGLWLAWYTHAFHEIWFAVKFICVLLLSWAHGYFAKSVRLFANDANEKSHRYWRMVNEIPAVLMIIIVVMVIVRPF